MSSEKFHVCKLCKENSQLIKEQKEKIQVMEKRLRDLVKAYKLVNYEKEALLSSFAYVKNNSTSNENETQSTTTTTVNANNSKSEIELRTRLSSLELNLTELSTLCGKYEKTRLENEQIINKLSKDCDELQRKLDEKFFDDNSCREKVVKEIKNKSIQVNLLKSSSENLIEKISIAVQTEEVCKQQAKKSELAIVLPTHREINEQVDMDNKVESEFEQNVNIVSNEFESDVNSSDERNERRYSQANTQSNTSNSHNSSTFPLFYVTELARKDIEVTDLKLRARETECTLRELQWRYNLDVNRLESKINELEREKKRLETEANLRPNLTYIRNVLTHYNATEDKNQRQCMMSALITALNASEKQN